jgi:DNA-binding PadR family transcriptional regulator
VRKALHPFSYVILALVGRGGASAHDIVQMMRRGRVYWVAAESHYYAEPKRLAELGYLDVETLPGKTTERRVYTLTELGERALEAWLAEPSTFPRIQNEAVLRLLASEYTSAETTRESLMAMRSELDRIDADLTTNLALADRLPHRAEAIRLVNDLGRRTVQAHRDWLAVVDDALARESSRPDR